MERERRKDMPRERDEELIKIKKREKKEKPEKEKRAKNKRTKKQTSPKVNATPRARGVKLDFTEETPEVNRYWLSVSKRYRAARFISIFLLCAFLFVMLAFFRENITYANLVYLVRDLDSNTTLAVGGYSDISYDRSTESDFGLFRSRIAVASPTGFKLYSQTGAVDLESDGVIADPRLEVSNKYALVYSAGDKKYSVYTTVARVLSAESDFAVEDAAVCDSGSYALLTRSQESRFLITVYGDSFQERTKYYKDSFVMDIALSKEGDSLAAVSAKIDTTATVCEVMIGKIGTKDTKTFEYGGMMPLSCEYTDDGRLVVICDSALLIFEGEKEIAKITFDGLTPGYFDVAGSTVAITFPTNVLGTSNDVTVYSTEGKKICTSEIKGKVQAFSTDGTEAAYVITERAAVRIGFEDGKTKTEECDLQVIRALAVPGSVIVFTPEESRSFFAD